MKKHYSKFNTKIRETDLMLTVSRFVVKQLSLSNYEKVWSMFYTLL
jgi:hypothetical protein